MPSDIKNSFHAASSRPCRADVRREKTVIDLAAAFGVRRLVAAVRGAGVCKATSTHPGANRKRRQVAALQTLRADRRASQIHQFMGSEKKGIAPPACVIRWQFPWPLLLGVLFAVAFAATAAVSPVEGVLYSTGFESSDTTPFSIGNLEGQGNWSVTEGSAVVQQAAQARGAQAVQAGQASFRIGLNNPTPSVLWVDAFYLEAGSPNQPMIPANDVSSVIFFSATQGILALDGDGNGNGNFMQVASSFATNEFMRVSMRNDYGNKTYDVWINGVRARGGLRFKNNSVAGFQGVQRRSNLDSYLDDFSVTTWGLDADSDGDGLIDLDEVKFHGSHPLLSDSDGDSMSDGQEILAGTDPADANSFFAILIDLDGQGHHRVRVPTINGRAYTLQRRAALQAGSWENVPGAIDVAGDGGERIFAQSNGETNYFYRAVVNP